MKKNIIILIELFIITFSIFGEVVDPYEGKNYTNAGVDIFFKEGVIIIDDYDTDDGKRKRDEYKYKYHCINKIPFLFLQDSNSTKYVALSSDNILLLYSDDNLRPLYGGFFAMKPCVLFDDYEIKTSSSYSDKKYTFPAKNISSLFLFTPWVEGVPGYGIGETISFTAKEVKPITGFYFSNGFVSFKKPYLYTQNSRVKKIRVTNKNKDFTFVYDIMDTPNLQYFEVKRNTQDLIIEILDVYPGTKWKDTAVNFILLDTREFVGYSSGGDSDK